MSMLTAKKSQMEIVGLVIIVILISIALLFFLRFSLGKSATEKRTYTSAQLASNMINTVAKTSTNCSLIPISELSVLCANGDYVYCDEARITEYDPCEIAKNALDNIFINTLEQWNKKYKFQIFIPEEPNNPFYTRQIQYPCAGNVQTETYYIPTGRGILYLKLNLCEE